MNFAAFFSYVLLSVITPGPNNIMAMTTACKYGLKGALRFVLGMGCGIFTVLSCSAAFTSLLYSYIPSIKPYMICVGAAYILFLAWKVWRDKPHTDEKGEVQALGFGWGVILQFVNVKLILYGITVFSTFILPHYHSFAAVSAFILLLTFIGFVCTSCWALFGSAFQKLFKKYGKVINLVMALLLVYCAVSMLLGLRF